METLDKQVRQARRALQSLGRALGERPTDIVRDSTIKRFEYSFDIIWKTLKRHLFTSEGLAAASPKSVFREALRVGLLSEREAEHAIRMTDDRNKTAHTYDAGDAQEVYRHIRKYYPLLTDLLGRITAKQKAK